MPPTPDSRRRRSDPVGVHPLDPALPSGVGPGLCLLADDDADLRRSMAHVLEAMGLSCIEAASGKEALTILEQTGELPLLVSDVSMPGLDGLEHPGAREEDPSPSIPRHLVSAGLRICHEWILA